MPSLQQCADILNTQGRNIPEEAVAAIMEICSKLASSLVQSIEDKAEEDVLAMNKEVEELINL